jgi:hypothetical protein
MLKNLFENQDILTKHILQMLDTKINNKIFPDKTLRFSGAAAVMLLIGQLPETNRFEPCFILNKRSLKVKQPGDICCPGGGIEPQIDHFLSGLLSLKFLPLARWPFWQHWQTARSAESKQLSLVFAAALREGFEEMGINPLGVKFLGPLGPEYIVISKREIFPVAGWILRQKRFFPNREVEKIIYIPIRNLLSSSYYARHEIQIHSNKNKISMHVPCFRHESELLWGATYRIVMRFLELVFEFKPPEPESLPLVTGILDNTFYHE